MTLPQAVAARLDTRRITRPGVPCLSYKSYRRCYVDEQGVEYEFTRDDLFSDERNASLLMQLGTFIVHRARTADPKKS